MIITSLHRFSYLYSTIFLHHVSHQYNYPIITTWYYRNNNNKNNNKLLYNFPFTFHGFPPFLFLITRLIWFPSFAIAKTLNYRLPINWEVNQYYIHLIIGNSNTNQPLYLPISLENEYTLITNDYYNKDYSTTKTFLLSDTIEVFPNQVKPFELFKELVSFPGNPATVNDFEFKLFTEPINNPFNVYNNRGIFALGAISAFNNSLSYLLQKQKYIKYNMFSFRTGKTQREREVIFGEPSVDEYYTMSRNNRAQCALSAGDKWSCRLHEITLEYPSYSNSGGNTDNGRYFYNTTDKFTYFTTNQWNTFFPKSFYNFLVEEVFADYLANKTCSTSQTNNGKFIFTCRPDVVGTFPVINFNFGNYKISFKLKKLFFCYSWTCYSHFVSVDRDENLIVLGISFMETMLMSFDYDKQRVIMHSVDDEVEMIKNRNAEKEPMFYEDADYYTYLIIGGVFAVLLAWGGVIAWYVVKTSIVKFEPLKGIREWERESDFKRKGKKHLTCDDRTWRRGQELMELV